MRIAVDFDNTIVSQEHDYNDLDTPLEFLPGAKEALESLKAAGHQLILWSGRSNLALRKDWRRNPLNRLTALFDEAKWEQQRQINAARYEQMLQFVEENLPDVFVYIDDGAQGKISADLYIDDRSTQPDWGMLQEAYGELGQDDTPEEAIQGSDDSGAGPREVRVPE